MLFPSYPRPAVELGYGVLNGRRTFKGYYTEQERDVILSSIPQQYVDNVSTWYDAKLGKHVITAIAALDSKLWTFISIPTTNS